MRWPLFLSVLFLLLPFSAFASSSYVQSSSGYSGSAGSVSATLSNTVAGDTLFAYWSSYGPNNCSQIYTALSNTGGDTWTNVVAITQHGNYCYATWEADNITGASSDSVSITQYYTNNQTSLVVSEWSPASSGGGSGSSCLAGLMYECIQTDASTTDCYFATSTPGVSSTSPSYSLDVGNVPLGLALIIGLLGFIVAGVVWEYVVRRKL